MAVKRIFRHSSGTVNHGLLYRRGVTKNCFSFSDADWAGDLDDRKSTSGFVFIISEAAISWRSKKQTCVALSTAETEYIALASAAQEAIWLRRLISELIKKLKPTVINEDNQAAIRMTKNPTFHVCTKHIAIKFHFIREHVEDGSVDVKFCNTKEMVADIFTTALASEQFIKLRDLCGVKELSSEVFE